MESVIDNDNIPQWKKDLIARLRNQNKSASVVVASSKDQQLCSFEQQQSSVRHLNSSWKNDSVPSGATNSEQCDVNRISSPCSPVKKIKMVQERNWVDPKIPDMVSENFNNNGYRKDDDSDSSEDLQYGPGIVKKLKNKYLSLALRESNNRPSIMHMRKATSLENLLDEDVPKENNENKHFQSRLNGNDTGKMPSSNRYHRRQMRGEMKRARSVETISRFDNDVPLPDMRNNRQSLHEDMLIAVQTEGNDATTYVNKNHDKNISVANSVTTNRQRINRPKRIQPIMNEKEKPPADFVKQAKMIFEKRPEQRTKKPPLTGDVAAKVDSFNSIIVKAKVEAKVSKKPPVKHSTKPVLNEKSKNINRTIKSVESKEAKPRLSKKILELNKVPNKIEPVPLPSPIPDVSRIDFHSNGEHENTNLSQTPDLILTSSPLQASSPVHKRISTETFLSEEIKNTSPVLTPNGIIKKITSPLVSPNRIKPASPLVSPSFNRPFSPLPKSVSPTCSSPTSHDSDDPDSPAYKLVSPSSINKISSEGNSDIYNFTHKKIPQNHLPVNKNVSIAKIPPSQPLKIDVNGHVEPKVSQVPLGPSTKLLQTQRDRPRSPPKFSPPPPPKVEKKPEKSLTVTEIEKNLINTAKTLQQPSVSVNNTSVEVVNTNLVPKKLRPREPASNTAVFNFTKRKDVPDYISNDTSRTPSRPELPKTGDGGIILIPGATILDSFVDEDEEILRSLEGPPSPCDVTFINDNILIDGKSSLSQKTKRAKLKISFVEAGPDVFEYPSETSLIMDDSPMLAQSVGHTVPNLGSSYLANYTPKTMEEFEPGVTRSVHQSIPTTTKPNVTELEEISSEMILQETERPFSSGSNTDILF